ncbi:hypothetical protein ACGC1H_005766 [Rhizoctonia solani]|uniref:Uncharacterized protein n=1 Tax=Rhizoctonia solani TaxID=456999 RepID=A0A8H3BEF1_9AGAM|nr:unnamed protein product [Rhizoctonia solani]
MSAGHAIAAPAIPENDSPPSVHSNSSQITSASVLAQIPQFKQWANKVRLNRTIILVVPENPPNSSNTQYDRIRSLKEVSSVFPAWLTEVNSPGFSHIAVAHVPLKEKLCSYLLSAIATNRATTTTAVDLELYRSIGYILQICLRQKKLNEAYDDPTKMDRRVSIDYLLAYICESDGIDTIKYSTEQKIKLPKVRGFNVSTTKADGVVFMDIPDFDPFEKSEELRDLGSTFSPGPPKRLKVIHCVAEYKRDGGGTNQALMGIVSGLYQKKVLNIAHQLVFGVYHVSADILQVIAGAWQGGWIRVYKVGKYSLRDPMDAVQFYFVMREIRRIGQLYLEELRQSEMDFTLRLMDQAPVDEWDMDHMDSITEDPSESNSQVYNGNGSNIQPGWHLKLSALGKWNRHERVLSYLESMSNNSTSSSEDGNEPQIPAPDAKVAPPNQRKSILVTTEEAAGNPPIGWRAMAQ